MIYPHFMCCHATEERRDGSCFEGKAKRCVKERDRHHKVSVSISTLQSLPVTPIKKVKVHRIFNQQLSNHLQQTFAMFYLINGNFFFLKVCFKCFWPSFAILHSFDASWNYFILSHGNYFWMKSVSPSLPNTLLHTVQLTDRLMWSCGQTKVGPGPSTLKLNAPSSQKAYWWIIHFLFSALPAHIADTGYVLEMPPSPHFSQCLIHFKKYFFCFSKTKKLFFLKRTMISTLSCCGQSALSLL